MGLIEGESLAARIRRRGRVPAEETRRIFRETADALSAAHAMSVIHRDIKPDNILLEGTRGRVVVTDFGIAKALSAASGSTLTSAGMAIGTPSYMSPEQAAGERDIDGRSDLYSLGIVTYQMLSGQLPFTAPTVAGILMKQITEPAPLLHETYRDVPEDLSLAVAQCLEKDPANRWASADALRRALESRTVSGYRPTGLSWKAQTRDVAPTRPSTTRGLRPPTVRPAPVRPAPPARPVTARPDPLRAGLPVRGRESLTSRAAARSARRDARALRRDLKDGPLPDTGEPVIVVRARRDFARWMAVNGGLFLMNMTFAGGPRHPWFLIPAAAMGMGLINTYSRLWQAGYSWRDVLHRPDAPDAVGSGDKAAKIKGVKPITEPTAAEFGTYEGRMLQVYKDRRVILSLMGKLSQTDREMLPEIVETTEGLYARAAQLAGTLGSMEALGVDDPSQVETRLAELRQRPAGEERDRQVSLLEQQLKRYRELTTQRMQFADRFESCVLAMQNVRLDLMRLKQSGVGAVLDGLTMATQQARALSRDVDHAIDAAAEVKAL